MLEMLCFVIKHEMLSNVFLFTGEEKYLLHQELKRWTDNFAQKFGTDTLFVFDGERFDLAALRQTLYSGGLFVTKKLIIVYGIPTDLESSNKLPAEQIQVFSEEFLAKEGQITSDTILIFVSYKPDKRTKFMKFLETNANVKNFEHLKSSELKNFVRQRTSGLLWTEDVLDYFLSKVGNDLYHIEHECEKLLFYCQSQSTTAITIKIIDYISFGVVESNSFAFFDLLFVDKKKCLQMVQDAQTEGINRNMFAGTLYWGLKTWLFILDLDAQGIQDSKVLASMLKAHPFVVAKALKQIQVLRRGRSSIVALYNGLVELDGAIKMGKVPDFYFWLEIKKLIIALF